MSTRVEWYLSESKAAGVESMTDDWVPYEIGRERPTGFSEPYDPERDDFVARDKRI